MNGTSQYMLKGIAKMKEMNMTEKSSHQLFKLFNQNPCLESAIKRSRRGMCIRQTQKVSLPTTHIKSELKKLFIHVNLLVKVGQIIKAKPKTKKALLKALNNIFAVVDQGLIHSWCLKKSYIMKTKNVVRKSPANNEP